MSAPQSPIPLGSVAFTITGVAPGSQQSIQRVVPRGELLKLIDMLRDAAAAFDKNTLTLLFDLEGANIIADYVGSTRQ